MKTRGELNKKGFQLIWKKNDTNKNGSLSYVNGFKSLERMWTLCINVMKHLKSHVTKDEIRLITPIRVRPKWIVTLNRTAEAMQACQSSLFLVLPSTNWASKYYSIIIAIVIYTMQTSFLLLFFDIFSVSDVYRALTLSLLW